MPPSRLRRRLARSHAPQSRLLGRPRLHCFAGRVLVGNRGGPGSLFRRDLVRADRPDLAPVGPNAAPGASSARETVDRREPLAVRRQSLGMAGDERAVRRGHDGRDGTVVVRAARRSAPDAMDVRGNLLRRDRVRAGANRDARHIFDGVLRSCARLLHVEHEGRGRRPSHPGLSFGDGRQSRLRRRLQTVGLLPLVRIARNRRADRVTAALARPIRRSASKRLLCARGPARMDAPQHAAGLRGRALPRLFSELRTTNVSRRHGLRVHCIAPQDGRHSLRPFPRSSLYESLVHMAGLAASGLVSLPRQGRQRLALDGCQSSRRGRRPRQPRGGLCRRGGDSRGAVSFRRVARAERADRRRRIFLAISALDGEPERVGILLLLFSLRSLSGPRFGAGILPRARAVASVGGARVSRSCGPEFRLLSAGARRRRRRRSSRLRGTRVAAVLALSGMLAMAGQIAPWLPSSMIAPASARSNSQTRPIARGDPAFARVTAALFLGAFTTFALLYSVQPLLPIFARDFDVSPAAASLSLSLATLTMAPALIVAGSASEVWGRKHLMVASLAASSMATLIASMAGDWTILLVLRALTGLALSGLPAVAMAYLADEMAPAALSLAMGLYIAGSTLGGMASRLGASALADYWSWRAAIAATGFVGLLGAAFLAYALPRERAFAAGTPDMRRLARALAGHFADPGLRLLFAEGFLVMGSLVCTYNYIGFRLAAPPFSLSQTTIGFVFALYLVGAASSALMGELAGRLGRRRVIWIAAMIELAGVAVTLPDNLGAVIGGVALITWGFFGVHSIASSWVGLRAPTGRAQATALYLFFYYLGSSVAGSAGGWFFARWAWPGVAGLLGALVGAALLVALRLSKVPPPRHLQVR